MFGVDRQTVARFEEQVRLIDEKKGAPPKRIDLFWEKVLLVEQKSAGKDLDKADEQAMRYYRSIPAMIKPVYVMSCDFKKFHLNNIETDQKWEFTLEELPSKLDLLGFMTGRVTYEAEIAVSQKATKSIKKIYDLIWDSIHPEDAEYRRVTLAKYNDDVKKAKKEGKKKPKKPSLTKPRTTDEEVQIKEDKRVIGRFLARLSYCFFAEDADIFHEHSFIDYVKRSTADNPNNLGGVLQKLFITLNTPHNKRSTMLDKDLKKFPYIDGRLFEQDSSDEQVVCNEEVRDALIDAASFDWSDVSPAVFGSMFESVMDPEERRESGSHYTAYENVMKVIKPLFLDELWDEFKKIEDSDLTDKNKKSKLASFQKKLAGLKFLDPACGSGSFLITTYSELRKLELQVVLGIHDDKVVTDSSVRSIVDVNQFYGIELNPFAAKITETAMWMADHQQNQRLSDAFGEPKLRIPLEKHANIRIGDALDLEWSTVLNPNKCNFIIGNPPFSGTRSMTPIQKQQTIKITNSRKLDYVANWFVKACKYASNATKIAFVSTNSITQGEQVSALWPIITKKYKFDIAFAHKQFNWSSDSTHSAGVVVVIIGLTRVTCKKTLFDNDYVTNPNYIMPYLFGTNKYLPIVVKPKTRESKVLPKLLNGCIIHDNGNYTFDTSELKDFLKVEPDAKQYVRQFINGDLFLNGPTKHILYLDGISTAKRESMPEVDRRMNLVKEFRSNCSDEIRPWANKPDKFIRTRMPGKKCPVFPRIFSSSREYMIVGYEDKDIIPTDTLMFIRDGGLALAGLLSSKMHMAWVNLVTGRLGTGIRYSNIIYNTFPVPKNYSKLGSKMQEIINQRTRIFNNDNSTNLAAMYVPGKIESKLYDAHRALDVAVDKLYRKNEFADFEDRAVFLLEKYSDSLK